jgi:hypothetical protein
MLPSASLFDRWIARPKRPGIGVTVAVCLLVAPLLVAWVEGEMPWLIETGRWRSILVAPVVITYVLAVAPRLAALEDRVLDSLRPLLADEQAGLPSCATGRPCQSGRRWRLSSRCALAVAMSRRIEENSPGWLGLVLEQALMYGLMGWWSTGRWPARVTSTLLGLDLKIDPWMCLRLWPSAGRDCGWRSSSWG